MIEVGEIIPTRTIVVRPESMPVWAAALRDPNPIHLDANATRAAGLGDRVINQGPANIGYLVNALLARFPNGRIVAMDFVFLDNVRGGDVAAASGKVVRVEPRAGVVRVECELALRVGDRTVLTGTATIDTPD